MSDRKEFEAFMASFNAQFRTTGGAAASPDTTAKPPTAIPPAMREGLQQMKAFLDDQDRGIENSKAQTTQTLEKIKEVNKDIEDLEQRLLLTKIAENKARRELEQKERDLKEKIETEKRAHEAEIRMLKKMIDEANFSTESDQHKSLRLKLEQEQLETERLNRDRDKILSELEELRAILQTEQQVKADLERQAEEKKEMYNKLKADHENKLKALKKQLCDALETQKNYMETLTESSAKKDALAASVKQKEAELHDTQLQITMVKQHNTNLHRERRHVAHKVEKERRSLEETIESYTKSMKRLSSSTKTHKTAVSKSHEIEKHHELFSKELNTLQEDIQDLDSFIVTEEHRLRSMTNYTRQLQEQNRELEDDIVDQKVLTAETTAAVVETAEHTLKTESAKHAHRTEKLQQHLQDLSRGKESAMEILEDSRNIISQNRAEVMLSRRKINAMDEQAESAQHQAQEVSAAVKDLQRQIHQDELSIASAEQLNKVSHHKIKQLNRAKARIQKETNNTVLQTVGLTTTAQAVQGHIDRITATLQQTPNSNSAAPSPQEPQHQPAPTSQSPSSSQSQSPSPSPSPPPEQQQEPKPEPESPPSEQQQQQQPPATPTIETTPATNTTPQVQHQPPDENPINNTTQPTPTDPPSQADALGPDSVSQSRS